MKKLFILFIMCSVGFLPLFGRAINENTAREVATFHLQVRNVQTAFSISNITTLAEGGTVLAYIVNLAPVGFIAIPSDTDYVPIIAYSFKSNYYSTNDPRNVLFNLLKKDLQSRRQALGRGLISVEENNDLWTKYIDKDIASFNRQSFQKWPERATARTDGLVPTTWNQLEPFNNSCPIDPTTGRRSTLSTAAISLAQIVNYYHYLGNASFGTADGYTTLSGVNIDGDNQTADFPSFTVMNTRLQNIDRKFKENISLNNNDISTLCFAAGMAVNTHFSSVGAITWTWDIAHAIRNKFNYRQAKSYYADDSEFYNHLQTNAKQNFPSILLFDANYEYSVICDGYNTAEEYHLNFGYANNDTANYTLAWYSLPTFVSSEFNILSQTIAYIGQGVEALTAPAAEMEKIVLDEEDLDLGIFTYEEEEEAETPATQEDVVDDMVVGALEGEDVPTIGTTSQFVIYEEPPIPVKQVRPNYPRMLRRSRIEGEVVLRVEVLDTGTVGAVEVVKSLMPGEGGFDEAAIEAVKKWEFTPAQSGGKPVACWVTFPVNFSLD